MMYLIIGTCDDIGGTDRLQISDGESYQPCMVAVATLLIVLYLDNYGCNITQSRKRVRCVCVYMY